MNPGTDPHDPSERGSRKRLFLPSLDPGEDTFLGDVFRRETVGGAVALVAAALAIVWANSPWGSAYLDLRAVKIGPLDLEHWAADGALTLFFFVAGLELKREFVVGSLRRPADAAVPVVAAACGVAVPALIYLVVNLSSADGAPGGWAIPAATDIAFALAVLAVVGSNLPTSLRAFLLTLAVVDDLIVIVIIAVFYTSTLHVEALALAAVAFALWALGQHFRIGTPVLYVPLAVAAWWLTHESGIHATIAGVVLGLLTRVRTDADELRSPAERLEHLLSPTSAAVAVPFFAFMSAGVVVSGAVGDLASSPVVIGVVLGLVVGKPIGVFGGTWVLTRFTRAELNGDLAWRDLVGVAVLAGVGFTVSLLVADLSFAGEMREQAKTAVLAGSLVSAVAGALVLGHRDRFHFTP
ncbi:Na+/H+ antiporter NhaA [Nocardioides sp. LHG3406-4]|uniref:Na+/H+ antiporter NhaA n=1 Tax=Nocardioides sp. LHG3406-4 TaxID=2804575 RepID=UPI003CEDBA3E